MTMTYRKNLKLVFDASALQSNKPNVSIELSYIGDQRERHPVPATPQIEFFVHLLRDHIRGALPLRAAKLLSLIGSGWDCATHVMDGIRLLDSTFPTTFHAASESRAELRSSILLAPLATKVEVVLALEDRSPPGGGALQIAVVPSARVIYGEHFNVAKLAEFLAARIPTTVSAEGAARAKNGGDLWSGAFVALQERLLARAKR